MTPRFSKLSHHRIAATRLGVPLDEYVRRLAVGERWCRACKLWHDGAALVQCRVQRKAKKDGG